MSQVKNNLEHKYLSRIYEIWINVLWEYLELFDSLIQASLNIPRFLQYN